MIWVIAGTLDGRRLAVAIQEKTKEPVLVSVVSSYGAQLAKHEGITVHTGRLTEEEMIHLIKEHQVRYLVDASHPYAAIVTVTAKAAAEKANIPFVRYERPEVELPSYAKLHHVKNEVEAARLAGHLGKRIYLTTGSKTMKIFAEAPDLQDKLVWTRVLPTSQVLQELEALHLSPKQIIAMQGPFSYDMNKNMFKDTQSEVVVMKNSGLVGGTDTKLAAAMDLGLDIIVIDRPEPPTGVQVITSEAEYFKLGV